MRGGDIQYKQISNQKFHGRWNPRTWKKGWKT